MSVLTWKEIEYELLAVADAIEQTPGVAPEPTLSKAADVIEKESNGKWMKES